MKKASEIDISKIDTSSVEFQNALKLIQYTRQSVFLTGKAGTGKSTFLQYLKATTRKKYIVLAPTGIAAVNAGGQTIHSFFKLPFKPMLPDDPEIIDNRRLKNRMKYNKDFIKLLRAIDLIIIDEVSMVRADTIDFIDRLLRVYCNWRQPFGGKQLLLVGDVFQLEPVLTGDTRDVLTYFYKDGTFFFNAHAFNDLNVVPIELTKVFRQKDEEFIGMLDRIRIGSPTARDIEMLRRKVVPDSGLELDTDFVMTIATRRDIVNRINEYRLERITSPEHTFIGVTKGEFPDTSLPTEKNLIVKVGAQVVFVKNDMERRWVNGTLGRIIEIDDGMIRVELEDGTKHTVEPEVWRNVRYEYDEESRQVKEIDIGSFEQLPIKLAWALTIHKSQGLTFDRVIIDVGNGAFSSGQTYVALSRCRSFDGIRLRSPITERDIFVNIKVANFARTFNNPMLIDMAMEMARADDCYHRAAVSFDKGDYPKAVRMLAQGVTARNYLDREDVVRLISMKMLSLADKGKQQTERIAQLEDELAQAKKRFALLAAEYVTLGEDCREQGWDMSAALANYEKAISLSPDYTPAWIGKGLTLADMGEVETAIESLVNASRLDPDDYRGLYEAGRLLLNSGDVAGGMDLLLQALDRNDGIAGIHLALADGYERVGESENAERHRLKAKKMTKNKRKDK